MTAEGWPGQGRDDVTQAVRVASHRALPIGEPPRLRAHSGYEEGEKPGSRRARGSPCCPAAPGWA